MITSLETCNPREVLALASYQYYMTMFEVYTTLAAKCKDIKHAETYERDAAEYMGMADTWIYAIDTEICCQIVRGVMRDVHYADGLMSAVMPAWDALQMARANIERYRGQK